MRHNMDAGGRSTRIDCNGTHLACEVVGEGPLVIAAHGFPDCAGSFAPLAVALSAAGYRVALPTMRGYHPSDRAADRRYHAESLGRDLLAVARHLSPDAPVRLVGHDWGAVAAYAAAALGPALVHQLVTLAVPHLRVAAPRWWWPAQLNRSWYMAALQPRGRGESRLLRDDLALVDRLWRDWSPNYRCPADHMRRVKNAIRERASEVIGYYRELPRGLSRPASKLLLRTTTVPAMYLHGQDDGCVGVSLCRGVERAYRAGVRLRVVRDAGHFLHLERPAEVNREILAFFDAG